MRVCDFYRKFVPGCFFECFLKCGCQVEFYSLSVEIAGNYYSIVSPAEKWEFVVSTFYILPYSEGCHSDLLSDSQQLLSNSSRLAESVDSGNLR